MPTNFEIFVDWDNTGDFIGTHDNISDYVLGSVKWSLGMRPFVRTADENTLSFVVDNVDKRFSPEHASSPLYGKLFSGKTVQLQYNGTPMWTGYVEKIAPDPFLYGKRECKFECVSLKKALQRVQIFTSLFRDVTADEILEEILVYAVTPTVEDNIWLLGVVGFSELEETTYVSDITQIANLDKGVVVFPIIGDNVQSVDVKADAYTLIVDLMNAERGHFFIARDGKATFWNRHHLLNKTVPDYSILNDEAGLDYVTPDEDLINIVEATFYPRAVSDTSDDIIWQLASPIELAPNEERQLFAVYASLEGPRIGAENVQIPSGTDFVTDAGVLITVEALGQRAEITLTNSTSFSRKVSTINLRGRAIKTYHPLTVRSEDAASVGVHGRRVLPLDMKAMSDYNDTKTVADYELLLRKDDEGRANSVSLFGGNYGKAMQRDAQIGDLIRIVDDQLSHDRNYYIVRETHSFDPDQFSLKTQWELEPADTAQYWELGVTGLGELEQKTYLSF